ncbi:hypothetical protein AMTR_s00174p00064640 [Amborella trichopoda]|uniref:Uncharacterized protein n=1 Tax=Amborella trichopoda TaxID=13333 RepID=U5CZD3_AMBTC|nr:hypothetical protein AMTR_s00174p00064640 [Amborella trichopoda]
MRSLLPFRKVAHKKKHENDSLEANTGDAWFAEGGWDGEVVGAQPPQLLSTRVIADLGDGSNHENVGDDLENI